MNFGDVIRRIEMTLPDLPSRGISVESHSKGLSFYVGGLPLHRGDTKYLELYYKPDGSIELHVWDGAQVSVVNHEDDDI